MNGVPPMPDAKSMSWLLEQLLGVDIASKVGPATDLEDPYAIAVAEYVNEAGEPLGTWICDRAFVAYAGGALSMMSPELIDDALKAPEVPTSVAENVFEILNIGSRLFIDAGFNHMKLEKVHWGPGAVPAALRAMIAEPAGRVDVWVKITGYGGGRAILMTGPLAVPASEATVEPQAEPALGPA